MAEDVRSILAAHDFGDQLERVVKTAEQLRACDVPDEINLWLAMTPARLLEINQRIADMKNTGTKEEALRFLRGGRSAPAAMKTPVADAKGQPGDAPEAQQETKTMQTTSNAAVAAPKASTPKSGKAKTAKSSARRATTKAKKPAKAAAARPAPKAVKDTKSAVKSATSKVEIVAKLLQRAAGCTGAEILAATGWPSVSVPAQAKAAGLKLRKEKEKGSPTRYFGAA